MTDDTDTDDVVTLRERLRIARAAASDCAATVVTALTRILEMDPVVKAAQRAVASNGSADTSDDVDSATDLILKVRKYNEIVKRRS